MRKKNLSYLGLAMALLLVSACGSSGGGLGDILGGGSSDQQTYNQTLRGTVDYVDLNNRSIYLVNATGYSNNLANGGNSGTSVRVVYDDRTTVVYQGQSHRPDDLERGDEVEIRTTQSGSTLMADAVTVLRDVSQASSSTYPNNGSSTTTLRGTIRSIDNARRTMQLDRSYGNYVTVDYDTNTRVVYNGRSYNTADLEIGDEVDLNVTDLGNSRFRAQDITVVRSTGSGGSPSSSSYATVRGTVRYVDTARRTIELDQTSWSSGFTGTPSSNTGTIIVQYGTNATVEVGGRANAVSGLERGDVIDVQVDRTGTSSSYFANRIILVRDVNVR